MSSLTIIFLNHVNIGLNRQIRELQAGTSQVFGHLVCESITSLASLGIALYFSWKLTLVLLATLPVSFIILWLASKSLEPAIQAQKGISAVASKHLTSSITAIDLVKVFNGYDQGVYHYGNLVTLAAKQYLIQARCSAIQMGYTSFWVINLFVIGFYYGIVLVNHGLNPGVVITTFYATLTSFQGIEALLPHWLVIIKGTSAGSFLSGLANKAESSNVSNHKEIRIKPEQCFGAIELSNVSMKYDRVLLEIANMGPKGRVCISFRSQQTSTSELLNFVSSRRNNIHRRKKRVGKKYNWEPSE